MDSWTDPCHTKRLVNDSVQIRIEGWIGCDDGQRDLAMGKDGVKQGGIYSGNTGTALSQDGQGRAWQKLEWNGFIFLTLLITSMTFVSP